MKIGFLSHIYPWVTQTFTFNEVQWWRKYGLNVDVISFKRPSTSVMNSLTLDMREEIGRTTYFSELSPGYWIRGFFMALKRPRIFVNTLWQVLTQPYLHFTTLKLQAHATLTWLRAIALMPLIFERRYTHIHADFAGDTATAAWILHQFASISFSFRSHTSYNPQLLSVKLCDAKFVLACSQYDRGSLIHLASEEAASKMFVNYLGIDCDKWSYDDHITCTERGLIICVGTLQEKKGQLYLIQACAILNAEDIPFHCVLIGDGPMREELERQIMSAQLQDKVTILGYIPNHEVKGFMTQATIVCLPSAVASNQDVDGIPFVLIEAMALGKPCVSTWVSGIPELIENEIDGLLIPEQNPITLAAALRHLLQNPELRTRLGHAARQKVEKLFNIEHCARLAVDVFHKFVKDGKNAN